MDPEGAGRWAAVAQRVGDARGVEGSPLEAATLLSRDVPARCFPHWSCFRMISMVLAWQPSL